MSYGSKQPKAPPLIQNKDSSKRLSKLSNMTKKFESGTKEGKSLALRTIASSN